MRDEGNTPVRRASESAWWAWPSQDSMMVAFSPFGRQLLVGCMAVLGASEARLSSGKMCTVVSSNSEALTMGGYLVPTHAWACASMYAATHPASFLVLPCARMCSPVGGGSAKAEASEVIAIAGGKRP